MVKKGESFVKNDISYVAMSDEYIHDGKRCVDVINPEVFASSHFTKPTCELKILDKLAGMGLNVALQGETVGPGVQGNIGGLLDWELRVFDIWDIDGQRYYSPDEVYALCEKLGVQTVPVLDHNVKIQGMTCNDFLKAAHGPTQIGTSGHLREGDVYKSKTTRFTFKAVNPEYLLIRGY